MPKSTLKPNINNNLLWGIIEKDIFIYSTITFILLLFLTPVCFYCYYMNKKNLKQISPEVVNNRMKIFDKMKHILNIALPPTQVYPEKNNHEIDIISIDSMDSLSNSNYSITESSDSNSSEYSFKF
jgi:hypothetical protein